ncbi:hypothetical protein RB195_004793 [Necator americanus]|uniref:Uncharacterized protein n=1 Tax=Necator americanus TaxID=51031 RepID=A0ABR1BJP9_NECAM
MDINYLELTSSVIPQLYKGAQVVQLSTVSYVSILYFLCMKGSTMVVSDINRMALPNRSIIGMAVLKRTV